MDKPTADKAQFFALSDHALLALEGRDAIAFAQAQCMSDLATLADGQWQWSGWLSPKGRVQALFALLRVGPETLWLLLPDGDAAALKAALERFVFRSKVKLRVPEDAAVCGSFAAPAEASGATTSTDAKGRVELDFGDGRQPRTLRICSGCTAPTDADALARWRAYDLAHGLPRPGSATLEAFTPQQLSLDRLQAYSVRKGCYPGQEIVARTHFLGQAKRGLALFGCDDVPASGTQVMEGERAIGTVVAGAAAAGESGSHPALALAVLPLERADDAPALRIEEAALTPVPLLDGLAR
ncbi:CAF17-like 4Fe-4S cluster assembly/insertion protein YgfZ [Luteimonas terricola]|uniref:Folate-binding protein YgfZ n=1 Tax=Luteimonas terricola TaxID=645597 RepID=A0ABQ2EEF4_9GAMM|nr:folate-binding protein [Luteimonas terricola]GGK07992.1 folate-binding protein YgfZ [Luteimonas terricola]